MTNDNLRKRWLIVIDWYCICKRAGETVNHLLLHCPIVGELWSMVYTLFGVSWVMPKEVVELLAIWPGKFRKHKNGVIWNVVPTVRCGAFGGRGVLRFLKEPKEWFMSWRWHVYKLCLGGQMHWASSFFLAWLICSIDVA